MQFDSVTPNFILNLHSLFCDFRQDLLGKALFKIRKTAMIRNQYNQVPHLSHDTKWESSKITINITKRSQEVSSFPSGDQKAAKTRQTQDINNTNHPLKSHHLGWSVKYLTGGLKQVSQSVNFTLGSDMDQYT